MNKIKQPPEFAVICNQCRLREQGPYDRAIYNKYYMPTCKVPRWFFTASRQLSGFQRNKLPQIHFYSDDSNLFQDIIPSNRHWTGLVNLKIIQIICRGFHSHQISTLWDILDWQGFFSSIINKTCHLSVCRSWQLPVLFTLRRLFVESKAITLEWLNRKYTQVWKFSSNMTFTSFFKICRIFLTESIAE